MKQKQLLKHITLNPKIMAGKPVLKGMRLTVQYTLSLGRLILENLRQGLCLWMITWFN